jgi:hypothetical protein
MWQIMSKLYLGDYQDAHNRLLLKQMGITHVLNCTWEIPCWYPDDFKYLHLQLADPDWTFGEHIPRICAFITAGRRRGGVLVHCHAGLNRSPSAILAYLCRRRRSLKKALEILQAGVGETDDFDGPDEIFLEQIRAYYEDLEE